MMRMSFRSRVDRFLRVATFGALICAHALAAAQEWPTVPLPDKVNAYPIGTEVSVHGMPMRMSGFVSPAPREQVAAWFRRSWPGKIVENRVGNKLVLGQGRGGFFVSVQLEALPQGTRGVVALTNLKTAAARARESTAAAERLLNRLPSGTTIVQQMSSRDGGKLSNFVVLSNSYGENVNRDRVTRMLSEDGLHLEREARTSTSGQRMRGLENGSTLFFKGKSREATVVLGRDPKGLSVVVMNTVTFMEQMK